MTRIVELCTDRLPCPPPKGGAIERYVFNLSKTLSRRGVEVHLIGMKNILKIDYDSIIVHAYDLSNPVSKAVRSLFSLISSDNANIPYITVKIYEILRRIQREYGEVDAIHTHYFTASFAPLLYKLHKPSILLLSHFHNEPKQNFINKFLAREYDALLAVSSFIKKSIIDRLGVGEDKIYVVYNAVDTEVFKPCNHKLREKARQELGLGNEPIILFVGRITWEKGLHHAILALHHLIQRGCKCKLAIVGPLGHFDRAEAGYFQEVIARLISKLGLANAVKYLGYFDAHNLYRVYCASDVVIVLSLLEDACPTVVLEALASGRPVVAYASGGIPEILPPFGGVIVKKGI